MTQWSTETLGLAVFCFYLLYPFLMRRHHFIGNFREEVPLYWVNWGDASGPFLFMSKTMLEVGWSIILWSIFNLEGWSSRWSYFIGVALREWLSLKVSNKIQYQKDNNETAGTKTAVSNHSPWVQFLFLLSCSRHFQWESHNPNSEPVWN